MVNYKIIPTPYLKGSIQVPGDKSISHRALMLSALAEGQTQIDGFLMGADNFATMRALIQMGVEINYHQNENKVLVRGVGLRGLCAPSTTLDMGNSGTAMRLLAGILSGQTFDSVLSGDESLCRRPMKRIVEPLSIMGAKINLSAQGTPPLKINGNHQLSGITYTLPVASAQVKSCILLAGLYAHGKTCVIEPAPTRDHTERLLKLFAYPINQTKNSICLMGEANLKAVNNIVIPGDISSAAFFMVAASITPDANVMLQNVGLNPTRIGIIHLLKMMGADIQIKNQREKSGEPVGDIQVKYAKLRGIEIPSEQVPLAIDEFPVLLIAATAAEGTTILRNAAELRVKESDRIAVMAQGLKILGIETETLPDGIVVKNGRLQGGEIDSQGDHRIAMAFAVGGCIAKAPIVIRNCDNVQTSFPNFIELAEEVGMKIQIQEH